MTPGTAPDPGLWALTAPLYLKRMWKHRKKDIALRVVQEWVRISPSNSSWFVTNFCALWETHLMLFHLNCFFRFGGSVFPSGVLMPWIACWGGVSTFFWRTPIISLDGNPKDGSPSGRSQRITILIPSASNILLQIYAHIYAVHIYTHTHTYISIGGKKEASIYAERSHKLDSS